MWLPFEQAGDSHAPCTFSSPFPALGEVQSCFCSGEFQAYLPENQRLRSEIPQHPSTNSKEKGEGEQRVSKGGQGWETGEWKMDTMVTSSTKLSNADCSPDSTTFWLTSPLQASPFPCVKWE